MSRSFPSVVDLNVGGTHYTTSLSTLTAEKGSLLEELFSEASGTAAPAKDSQGRYFIDRDGGLFKLILDYLRSNKQLYLPENFGEKDRLKNEAEYYRLTNLVAAINNAGSGPLKPLSLTNLAITPMGVLPGYGGAGYITVGYRGSFAFGRDGLADVKFRKLTRIIVAGKVTLCREVFGETLNESRDPDNRGLDDSRYTARFFLKHLMLEQAFDNLQEAGFRCVASCGSGTSCGSGSEPLKPGMDSEETRWNHYNEYVFIRP